MHFSPELFKSTCNRVYALFLLGFDVDDVSGDYDDDPDVKNDAINNTNMKVFRVKFHFFLQIDFTSELNMIVEHVLPMYVPQPIFSVALVARFLLFYQLPTCSPNLLIFLAN